jgi:uncharacterized protein
MGGADASGLRDAKLAQSSMVSYSPSVPTDSEKRMRPWLRTELVASWYEVVLVIFCLTGYFVVLSTWQAWDGSNTRYIARLLTDSRMLGSTAFESAVLGLLLIHLNWRGWEPHDFRIWPNWRDSAQGLLLIIRMFFANLVVVSLAYTIWFVWQSRYSHVFPFLVSQLQEVKPHGKSLSWFTLLISSAVNGTFEEVTCIAYAFNQLAAKQGPAFALIAVVLLRMLCHTYQGLPHALGVGASFIVSGLYYWRTRKLWPLIFGHIVADAFALGILKILHP